VYNLSDACILRPRGLLRLLSVELAFGASDWQILLRERVSEIMIEGLSSNLGVRLRPLFWPTALIAIFVVRAVVSFAAKPGSTLLSYGGISYFLLLLLATGFAIRNGIQNTLGSRPFWALLALGYSLWVLDQWIFLYHEFVLHTEVPDNSIADPVLFLHIVPFMAAVATLPTLHLSGPRLYRVFSNFLLFLFFWGFLYFYAVFPYQYLFFSTTGYALRFDILYLIENLTLVAVVGILSLRVQYPWKMICLHLLGASALYALSSAVANVAIDSGGYVYGKMYGLGLTASACWFVWVPVRAQQITKAEVRAARFDTGQGSPASAWSMLVVVVISVPLVWELFQKDETAAMRRFRLLVAIAAIMCLAVVAYIKEHFAKSELISQLTLANDRLHLAVEAGKSVAWEWDFKTGRLSWFGDLQNIFGIPSDTYIGRREDLYRYVHPEDHELVAKAVEDARQSRKPYAAEFRVVRADGIVRWIASRGQFYYGSHGDTQRMLGIAVDITERRQVQEALHLFRKLIDQSSDAIEVVDPETLRFLDVNESACRDLGYTRDELLSLKVSDIDPSVDEFCRSRIANELAQSGFVTFESLHQRKDGSTFPVEINLKRVELDRVYNVNVVRDITERKRVEAALRQKSEELTEAQRLAGLGSWQWDARTDTVIWSEELYRLHGLDPNLPAPPFKDFPSLFTAESWDRLQSAVKALKTGTSYELDLEIVGSDPTTKWVVARGEPLRDADGQIIGLRGTVQDITARKQAEQAQGESEDKLRLILDSTAEAIYGIDLECRCTFCNPACLRLLGYDHADELLGKNMHHLIHQTRGDGTPFPVEECRILRTTRTGEGDHVDDEVLWRANGTSFPAEYWCYPQRKGREVVGTVVAFFDITARKLADAALAGVSGKLIEAQEQERRRIARELHDDIGQRLALLGIGLAQLQQSSSNPSAFPGRIGELQMQTSEIAADVQSLSHELHSSKLQYLGLAAALKGFSQEFSEQQKVEVDFKTHDLPTPLSPDISLCFFRVLQEALHNAAKHSGVRHFEVRLWGTPDEIHLTIADSGVGFDVEAAKASRGLGLISMQERLKLLNGTLAIESQLQRGTTLHASVPHRSDLLH
jgi:PAS domain S-box-containing protein